MHRKPLLKRDIEYAQSMTKSAAQAARFLNVAYKTYKKYAKLYGIFHTNPTGKGIPQFKTRGTWGLQEVFEGKHPHYSHKKLIARMIASGIKDGICDLCGFDERRVDGQYPLRIHFRDLDRKNFSLENLEFYCYNCYFLTSGRIGVDVSRNHAPPPIRVLQDDWDNLNIDDEELDRIRSEALRGVKSDPMQP